mmetsp:Transcript_130434/g.194150  ORF Transcript_130434/g.194150 Transcript_130434/m.194150 type:complete len:925 (+) Transcript_130434:16-2790(+)
MALIGMCCLHSAEEAAGGTGATAKMTANAASSATSSTTEAFEDAAAAAHGSLGESASGPANTTGTGTGTQTPAASTHAGGTGALAESLGDATPSETGTATAATAAHDATSAAGTTARAAARATGTTAHHHAHATCAHAATTAHGAHAGLTAHTHGTATSATGATAEAAASATTEAVGATSVAAATGRAADAHAPATGHTALAAAGGVAAGTGQEFVRVAAAATTSTEPDGAEAVDERAGATTHAAAVGGTTLDGATHAAEAEAGAAASSALAHARAHAAEHAARAGAAVGLASDEATDGAAAAGLGETGEAATVLTTHTLEATADHVRLVVGTEHALDRAGLLVGVLAEALEALAVGTAAKSALDATLAAGLGVALATDHAADLGRLPRVLDALEPLQDAAVETAVHTAVAGGRLLHALGLTAQHLALVLLLLLGLGLDAARRLADDATVLTGAVAHGLAGLLGRVVHVALGRTTLTALGGTGAAALVADLLVGTLAAAARGLARLTTLGARRLGSVAAGLTLGTRDVLLDRLALLGGLLGGGLLGGLLRVLLGRLLFVLLLLVPTGEKLADRNALAALPKVDLLAPASPLDQNLGPALVEVLGNPLGTLLDPLPSGLGTPLDDGTGLADEALGTVVRAAHEPDGPSGLAANPRLGAAEPASLVLPEEVGIAFLEVGVQRVVDDRLGPLERRLHLRLVLDLEADLGEDLHVTAQSAELEVGLGADLRGRAMSVSRDATLEDGERTLDTSAGNESVDSSGGRDGQASVRVKATHHGKVTLAVLALAVEPSAHVEVDGHETIHADRDLQGDRAKHKALLDLDEGLALLPLLDSGGRPDVRRASTAVLEVLGLLLHRLADDGLVEHLDVVSGGEGVLDGVGLSLGAEKNPLPLEELDVESGRGDGTGLGRVPLGSDLGVHPGLKVTL